MSFDKYAISPEQAQAIINQANTPKEGKKDYNDPRFFKPSIRDPKDPKDQRPEEYQALVRILPRGFDKDKPFAVHQMEHFFRESNIWFSKKCRLTLGDKEACPVCDSNWKMWNLAKETRDEALKAKARNRMPKENYICNVYIIKDIVHPENNGKVMLWKMTKNMYDIIMSAMKPQQKKASAFEEAAPQQGPSQAPFIPYDVVNGRNLVVHLIRDAKTQIPSYSSSYWYKPENGPVLLAKTEQEIDAILRDCNDLMEFISDVPTVEILTKELANFQAKLTNQFTQGEAHSSVFTQPNGGAIPPATAKPPAMGNSADLFGNTQLKPIQNTAPAPVQEAQAPVAAPIRNEEVPPASEDDLPF